MFKRWLLRDENGDAPAGGGGEAPPETSSASADFEPALLSESEDGGETGEAALPAPEQAQPVAPPPSAAPQVQQPPAPAPVAAPVAAPAPAPAPAAPTPAAAQPPATPATPPDPTARAAALATARNNLISELETRYAVTEEQGTAMMTEPEKAFPPLIARLFVDIYEAVFQQITAQVPSMYQDLRQRELAQNETQKAFYQQWPALAKPEFEPHVNRLATQYMQLNPGASREQAFNEIGQLAHITLKVPFNQDGGAPAPPSPPTATRPFTPALPGATSGGPAGAAPAKNFYEALAEEFERVD